jgi:metal-dependent amidase/aminoacylase/carboxypeptidase family protein
VLPSLRKVAGAANVKEMSLITGGEDFAYYGQKIPAFFFMVGVTPKGTDVLTAPANHSALFYLDETALPMATRAMIAVTTDYLNGPGH